MASVLGAAVAGSKKTKMMYSAGLNTRVTERYLDQLLQSGLLSCNDLAKTYFLTQKGSEFLRLFSEYEVALKDVFARRMILDDFIESCEPPSVPGLQDAPTNNQLIDSVDLTAKRDSQTVIVPPTTV